MNIQVSDMSYNREHLEREPRLYIRVGDRLIKAPQQDQEVARSYPEWPDKGALVDGLRVTILTARQEYRVGEEVRVIHILEATEPGHDVYIMGPKPVYGEYVNDSLATAPVPDVGDPWVPQFYDGAVLQSPAVDYAYEITRYFFSDEGVGRIQWRLGILRSNTLTLKVSGDLGQP